MDSSAINWAMEDLSSIKLTEKNGIIQSSKSKGYCDIIEKYSVNISPHTSPAEGATGPGRSPFENGEVARSVPS